MIDIIVAAGYATRLYPLTENFPKGLLTLGGNTIMGRLLDDVDGIEEVSSHVIVTNHRFAGTFREWARARNGAKPVEVLDDGTSTNETRLGAVGDLLLALDRLSIDGDILVMAGDNVLDFSLRGFVDFARERGTSCVMCHEENDIDKLRRTGVITVDGGMRVLSFEEKPVAPASNLAVPPFYVYAGDDLPLVRGCLANGCGYDAPGNLARYLSGRTVVHAWMMPGKRHDIGTLESYEAAKGMF